MQAGKRLLCLTICTVLVAILTGCATTKIDHQSVPAPSLETASIPEFESARTWADEISPAFYDTLRLRLEQTRRSGISRKREMTALALSGGGSDGAFGAGVLSGWTARGDRPDFEIVSGVSTGALIAPFAFIGPDYDRQLADFYTSVTTKDILKKSIVGGLLGGGSAVTSSAPLAGIIAEVIDAEFLEKIAQEHEKGRRLFVITTNIEAERAVVWDLGQIATHRSQQALALVRSAILASASIPVVFPPVRMRVFADGQAYDELHVDGATITNVFLAPVDVSLPGLASGRRVTIYVIRNGKLEPEYKPIKAATLRVAEQAMSTLSKYQNNADLRRLQTFSDGNGFRLLVTWIPNEFDTESKEPFDTEYMNALYNFGYTLGASRELWSRKPAIF